MEVADLFTAVRQLPKLVANKGEIDPARIGFWGWSYGGFLAARVFHHLRPEQPHIGVAGIEGDRLLEGVAGGRGFLALVLHHQQKAEVCPQFRLFGRQAGGPAHVLGGGHRVWRH